MIEKKKKRRKQKASLRQQSPLVRKRLAGFALGPGFGPLGSAAENEMAESAASENIFSITSSGRVREEANTALESKTLIEDRVALNANAFANSTARSGMCALCGQRFSVLPYTVSAKAILDMVEGWVKDNQAVAERLG